jgi:hypothetical protein
MLICIKKLRWIGLQLYDASWFASCVSDFGSQVYLNVALMKEIQDPNMFSNIVG